MARKLMVAVVTTAMMPMIAWGSVPKATAGTIAVEPPHITPTAVAGAAGYLWMSGTYPCLTGTCLALMRSSDGGNSWLRVGSPPAAADSLEFANREDGYAYGGSHSLYWTGDGGETWNLALADYSQVHPLPVVISRGRAYALVPKDCSADGECKALELASSVVTSDVWTTRQLHLPVGEASQPVGLAAFGSKVWLLALGPGGKAVVLVSDHGGKSFASLPSTGMGGLACYATATSLTTVWGFCATGSLGYAARSVDGGRSFALMSGWNRGYKGNAANSGVILPLSNKEAVYSPSPSYLYVTRDGGMHFSYLMGKPAAPVLQVAFASLTTWVVLGFPESGTNLMWRTINGGHSWESVEAPRV